MSYGYGTYEKSYYDMIFSKREIGDMAEAIEGIYDNLEDEENLITFLRRSGLGLLGFHPTYGLAASVANILIDIFKDDGGYKKGLAVNLKNTYSRLFKLYRTMSGTNPNQGDKYVSCKADMETLVIEGVEIPVYFVEKGFETRDGRWILA
ncbi:hypothetical protein [Sporanaerobacter acetigenes]|uniref:hypothetical protein n=1 Tax=Sporanaerobacter acetigenes TaxID=165813 RepID=UPI003320AA3A